MSIYIYTSLCIGVDIEMELGMQRLYYVYIYAYIYIVTVSMAVIFPVPGVCTRNKPHLRGLVKGLEKGRLTSRSSGCTSCTPSVFGAT